MVKVPAPGLQCRDHLGRCIGSDHWVLGAPLEKHGAPIAVGEIELEIRRAGEAASDRPDTSVTRRAHLARKRQRQEAALAEAADHAALQGHAGRVGLVGDEVLEHLE